MVSHNSVENLKSCYGNPILNSSIIIVSATNSFPILTVCSQDNSVEDVAPFLPQPQWMESWNVGAFSCFSYLYHFIHFRFCLFYILFISLIYHEQILRMLRIR